MKAPGLQPIMQPRTCIKFINSLCLRPLGTLILHRNLEPFWNVIHNMNLIAHGGLHFGSNCKDGKSECCTGKSRACCSCFTMLKPQHLKNNRQQSSQKQSFLYQYVLGCIRSSLRHIPPCIAGEENCLPCFWNLLLLQRDAANRKPSYPTSPWL